ncbi:MAG: hypothetical protein WC455_09415 [Dehalococcoidia bacterium]|jgi:hypothetical protein
MNHNDGFMEHLHRTLREWRPCIITGPGTIFFPDDMKAIQVVNVRSVSIDIDDSPAEAKKEKVRKVAVVGKQEPLSPLKQALQKASTESIVSLFGGVEVIRGFIPSTPAKLTRKQLINAILSIYETVPSMQGKEAILISALKHKGK